MNPNGILLNLQIINFLSHHEGRFLLQYMRKNTETYNQTMC